MMGRQSGLGRGLGALIPQRPTDPASPTAAPPIPPPAVPVVARSSGLEIQLVGAHLIDPNPHQPRRHFDHQELDDLVSSIKEYGILQPLVVTSKPDGRFELIAGERRLRAAKIAEFATVPAIVRTATEQQKMELALIENVQRADLNPIEEAEAYVRLQEEFGLTQEDLSKRVGKSRPQVANMIRLLQLPDEIQQALMEKKISTSNARTLLSLPTEDERLEMFRAMLAGNFTVRQTEARVPHARRKGSDTKDANVADLEIRLRDALGAKVVIKRDAHGEGQIRIAFFSDEDLQGLVERIEKK